MSAATADIASGLRAARDRALALCGDRAAHALELEIDAALARARALAHDDHEGARVAFANARDLIARRKASMTDALAFELGLAG